MGVVLAAVLFLAVVVSRPLPTSTAPTTNPAAPSSPASSPQPLTIAACLGWLAWHAMWMV